MSLAYLIKGFIIGLSVAAPVGPIGVLTIRRTLTEGRTSGFITGMGAAVADTVYGSVAGFGLTTISLFLITQGFWLKWVGGLFLVYLGIKFFLSKPASASEDISGKGLLYNFVSTFFLTLTNPATILSFLAIFAGLGIASEQADYISSMTLVGGVFIGSSLWWLILSSVVSVFQSGITTERLIWINRLSGMIIISFGLWALYSGITEL